MSRLQQQMRMVMMMMMNCEDAAFNCPDTKPLLTLTHNDLDLI